MKGILFLLFLLQMSSALAQDAQVTPVPTLTPLSHWDASKVPWDSWFEKKANVTDKTDYIYIYWDAQSYRGNFEVKDKKKRLAEAALELASRLYPSESKIDLIKLDISYLMDLDSYGEPKWDSLQQVAHFEFSRAKVVKFLKSKKPLTDAQMKNVFSKFEIY